MYVRVCILCPPSFVPMYVSDCVQLYVYVRVCVCVCARACVYVKLLVKFLTACASGALDVVRQVGRSTPTAARTARNKAR